MSVKNRHEPVPQPEGQRASRPECLATQLSRLSSQAAGVTFQLPREGRRACLSGVSRDTTLLSVWPRFESSAKFPGGRGHHIPAPLWEGCRATIQKLLSCSAVPAGGCRSSGWALVLLAVACFSRWLVGFWLFRFPFRGRRPEDRSEVVGIKEGVPASQSVLLLGPEHLLRWGCHSMSSCDGVRPIFV